MILKIIVNIVLSISLFFEIVTQDNTINILKNSALMSLICISISLYILSDLKFSKKYRNLILLGNGIYLCIASFIFNPLVVLIPPVICDYIKSKKYNDIYVCACLLISLVFQVKIGVSYSLICLGVVATLFTYETVKNTQKIEELDNIQYSLRENINLIEGKRALENKLNLQNIESMKIEERNLISQKIHDNIGHTLAGSIMQLEALKIVADKDVTKGIKMIDSIANNLREGMDEIRNTLRKIKPEQSELGINKLKLILEEFSKENKIVTYLNIEGDIEEVNILYWRVMIESIKEILTNTIKYSNGDSVSIDLCVLNQIVRLYVKDNGNYKGKIHKGMGLLGIEERVVNLGGNVIFNNEDGFSTLIILKR